MNAHWYISKNVGDTLTPFIVKHFTGHKVKWMARNFRGKLLGVGSIMKALRPRDAVWGSGIMRQTDTFAKLETCKFLAVRGKLTRDILVRDGGVVPEVYGDPALLLPLMYNPEVKKTHRFGVIPHYIEQKDFLQDASLVPVGAKVIDVFLPWEKFVSEVLACEEVISSSLHGIVIAEAYGIPATWVCPTPKVIGAGFKFKDYLTGTGRDPQGAGKFPPIPNLKQIQDDLITALNSYKAAL